jgi:hypothetical protein
MTLFYSTSTKAGSLRTIHTIVIYDERLETTRAKEILVFAKPRIPSKYDWKLLKEAVRLGEPLELKNE